MAVTGYPWGKASPATRIRETSAKARSGLDKAATARFGQIVDRAAEAARASQSLADTLDYLSRAGLRTRGGKDPIEGTDVAAAVEAVHQALAELGVASVVTLSDCYNAYASAVETLIQMAEDGATRGISGSGAPALQDPWSPFAR